METDLRALKEMIGETEHITESPSMKYIVASNYGELAAVVFPQPFNHIDIAKSHPYPVVSAGECKFKYTNKGLTVEAYGESYTLKKAHFAYQSKGEDDASVIISSYGWGEWTYLPPYKGISV